MRDGYAVATAGSIVASLLWASMAGAALGLLVGGLLGFAAGYAVGTPQ